MNVLPVLNIWVIVVQAEASDALALPGEEGELTSALRELSALMNGLAEDLVMESPAHRRALLRTSLPASLRAVLGKAYAAEADVVIISVQEALQSVARAVAKASTCCLGCFIRFLWMRVVVVVDSECCSFWLQVG